MGLFFCMFFEKYFILIFFLGIIVRWSLVIYFECCGYVYFEKKKIKRLCIRLLYDIKEDKESDKIMCVNKRCIEFSFIVCMINFVKI